MNFFFPFLPSPLLPLPLRGDEGGHKEPQQKAAESTPYTFPAHSALQRSAWLGRALIRSVQRLVPVLHSGQVAGETAAPTTVSCRRGHFPFLLICTVAVIFVLFCSLCTFILQNTKYVHKATLTIECLLNAFLFHCILIPKANKHQKIFFEYFVPCSC